LRDSCSTACPYPVTARTLQYDQALTFLFLEGEHVDALAGIDRGPAEPKGLAPDLALAQARASLQPSSRKPRTGLPCTLAIL
jgi:hypothetical protein